MSKNITIGFFGGPDYSVLTLEKLHRAGFTIAFIVTSLDKPKGRDLVLTPPPAKSWGIAQGIPVLQPTSLKADSFQDMLRAYGCDVFVVMAFGRIIPEDILHIPRAGSLNIHPSLLPKFRGSCPIESSILADERETGVTIMQMDKEMDHGPIVAQEKVAMDPWPPAADVLGVRLVDAGASLLVSILPDWVAGKITPAEQDHSQATYTTKIKKGDGLIDLASDPYQNYLKIQAYRGWPSAYFFTESPKGKIRVKITQAIYRDGKLVIEKVIPEGKGEMSYETFLTSSRQA